MWTRQQHGNRGSRLVSPLLVLLLLVLNPLPAWSADFPALTGRVTDGAEIIPADKRAEIEALILAHEQVSTDQIVVATIPSLEGAILEDYANRLFRHWQLGQKDVNNGVLLLVAVSDRKVRIEVGYGLEGALTDALSRLIIENAILPAFRSGDFPGGLVAGTRDIIAVLAGDSAGVESRARQALQSGNDLEPADVLAISLFVLIFGFVVSMAVFSILARIYGTKIGKHTYKWLGITISTASGPSSGRSGSRSSGWSSGSSGFSGGGGSSGGGGASGSW